VRHNLDMSARSELKSPGYEIFIGILSVLSILNLVLVYAVSAEQSLQTVLLVMNGLFSAIFLGDFLFRLATAPAKGSYFFAHFGWADLLASLPFPQLKILRVFRLMRVYRLLRDVGPRTVWRTLVRDRAGSALLILLLMGILVLQFGSLLMLYFEQYAPGANITTASDALWYTIVTISTVGYGDRFPVTDAGRLWGSLIIVIGVGIFGTFTGYLANLFLSPRKSEKAEAPESPSAATTEAAAGAVTPVADSPARSAATVEELRALLDRSEVTLADMRRLLA
jgi:voltage-gated potassium channel Kch